MGADQDSTREDGRSEDGRGYVLDTEPTEMGLSIRKRDEAKAIRGFCPIHSGEWR